ncbi:unnamed protein product [Somion occarium]|uniref:BTB domain-containing protein n=1 Tax=Somion occarium TaxID=3059160 RepID=A0ABP1DMG7_9APHY
MSERDIPQLLTPVTPSTSDEPVENIIVSVSTTFFPGAEHAHVPGFPDFIIVSSDSVHFYVHVDKLLDASKNGFNSLLPLRPEDQKDGMELVLKLPETSSVLNIILHTIYTISCAHYSPTVDVIVEAVNSFPKYGIPVGTYVALWTPLYQLILSVAPYSAIEMYALAASHDLYDLAVPISSHLLGFPLSSITDDLATRIGPVYLKRLVFLYLNRMRALKQLLLCPPRPHEATEKCDTLEQKKLTRAWALGAANLVWDARPDLSASSIISVLSFLTDGLTCTLCHDSLQARIRELVVQWSDVKTTI